MQFRLTCCSNGLYIYLVDNTITTTKNQKKLFFWHSSSPLVNISCKNNISKSTHHRHSIWQILNIYPKSENFWDLRQNLKKKGRGMDTSISMKDKFRFWIFKLDQLARVSQKWDLDFLFWTIYPERSLANKLLTLIRHFVDREVIREDRGIMFFRGRSKFT